MEIIFYAFVGALLMVLFFLAGMYVACVIDRMSREEADYQYRKIMAYRMAGVQRPGDPLPYVAPPVRRRRKIPHLKEIEERLSRGDRATVKVEDEE